MRISIINYLACPKCQAGLLLSISKKTKERVVEGELRCKKCGRKFYIKNEITCFASCSKKQFEKDAQKLRKTTIEQEIPGKWMQFYSKLEIKALKKEWAWMLSVIKKNKNAIHLDFATGTGRFLRNVVPKTKGEIIALDNGYGTCQELQYFLKKIKQYSQVSIVCADAREMPFRDEAFNSVSSWHGLDGPKMKNAIKEAKRTLKSGGYLAIAGDHYQKEAKSFLVAKKHGINLITKEEVIGIFRKSRFNKIEQKIFFEGCTDKNDFPLPAGDFYSMYAVRARK